MLNEYYFGTISRRVFCERLIAVIGTYPLAHHLLFHEIKKSGLAMPLSSPAGCDLANVVSYAVKYPATGATLEAYLAKPKGPGPFPAVILVHDNLGLNDQIRDTARRLAGQGLVTLAPDLLSRHGGTASFASPEETTKAFQKIKDDDVFCDLNSAYDYLNQKVSVKKDEIALMGFGWGGQRSFRHATVNSKVRAAAVFYAAFVS